MKKIILILGMIKFSHSIFALPFALISLFVATNGHPSVRSLLLIVFCMVTARSAAMTFNRIVDAKMDALNPRTQTRAIPSGQLSLKFCVYFCLTNCLLFLMAAYSINPLTFALSPLALVIVLGYSLTKRFTHLTQLFLGLALGIAPIATWIAATGKLSLFPILLGIGVLFWVAGFDLIYSCQDYDFDRTHNLKNLATKLGIRNSLHLSKAFHILAVLFFSVAGFSIELGAWYFVGVILVSAFLVYEHSLVSDTDLSKIDMAFFTLNGYVAVSFFLATLIDIYF